MSGDREAITVCSNDSFLMQHKETLLTFLNERISQNILCYIFFPQNTEGLLQKLAV